MAGNKVTLEFIGDAGSLEKASKQADTAVTKVGDAADKSGKDLAKSSDATSNLGTKMGHLGSTVSGAADALSAVSDGLQAVVDLEQAGAERASKLARATLDVQQAQEDYNQALRDSRQAQIDAGQAQIDLEQANLDAAKALQDYNKAVKEHGVNSLEAKQAAIDLKQAQQDITQAQEDSEQATRDGAQATIDAKTAQQDLNDANREAHPPELQKWADGLALITPLLSSVVAIVGLVTAAQWLWNASLFASPITWIVLAIVALVAIIVIIATKTTWFQDIWNAAWGGIKKAAGAVWSWMKDTLWPGIVGVFKAIGEGITAPFRIAFNAVAKLWNNTLGRLSWTVPDWVPGIGGNSISVPKLPTFHRGGIVPGGMGAEVLAVLQAGERVTPAGGGHSEADVVELAAGGDEWDALILAAVRRAVGLRGGDPVRVLRGNRG